MVSARSHSISWWVHWRGQLYKPLWVWQCRVWLFCGILVHVTIGPYSRVQSQLSDMLQSQKIKSTLCPTTSPRCGETGVSNTSDLKSTGLYGLVALTAFCATSSERSIHGIPFSLIIFHLSSVIMIQCTLYWYSVFNSGISKYSVNVHLFSQYGCKADGTIFIVTGGHTKTQRG